MTLGARCRRDPVVFCREALQVTPLPWQEEALRLVAAHDRVAIRSGHGVGKSAFLAWLVLWFLVTRGNARIPCTAPTRHQLADVLWSEIAKWRRRMRPELAAHITMSGDYVALADAPHECFAVARTARRDQPEAFQGFHGENLLFIADEASGVEDTVFEAGEGAMATPGAKTVLAGNPTRTSGYFYNAFHRDRAAWKTVCVPCADSAMVATDYARGMAERYGADSNIYRVRVLGEFPTAEEDQVIALALCESAVRRDVAAIEGARIKWGVDVARFGPDRSALAKRRGNVLLEPVKAWRNKTLMEVAGLIRDEYARCREDEVPDEILVDTIGLGAGVLDRLREDGLPARGVNVGAATTDANGRFLRLRDELWWRAREWFETGTAVLPDDQALIGELSLPRYSFNSDGRIKVESKDEMKSRAVQSPDLADAFCLTFAGGIERASRHIATMRGLRRWRRRRRALGGWMSA